MPLRSSKAYGERVWIWDFVTPAFSPTRIQFSDLDGIVERRGNFLVLEGKPSIADLYRSFGQRLLFEALAKLPNWTVLLIEGIPPRAIQRITRVPHWQTNPLCDQRGLMGIVRYWFTHDYTLPIDLSQILENLPPIKAGSNLFSLNGDTVERPP